MLRHFPHLNFGLAGLAGSLYKHLALSKTPPRSYGSTVTTVTLIAAKAETVLRKHTPGQPDHLFRDFRLS
jgi:hypothetical protein